MIIFIDKIERYIRLNMGFEINKGSFEELEKEYFDSFKNNGIFKNIYLYFKYKRKFKRISVSKDKEKSYDTSYNNGGIIIKDWI